LELACAFLNTAELRTDGNPVGRIVVVFTPLQFRIAQLNAGTRVIDQINAFISLQDYELTELSAHLRLHHRTDAPLSEV
jgi:hypothetical protein